MRNHFFHSTQSSETFVDLNFFVMRKYFA